MRRAEQDTEYPHHRILLLIQMVIILNSTGIKVPAQMLSGIRFSVEMVFMVIFIVLAKLVFPRIQVMLKSLPLRVLIHSLLIPTMA